MIKLRKQQRRTFILFFIIQSESITLFPSFFFVIKRDPVYGAFFSNLLLGETLGGATGWAGAILITVAAATNALLETSSTSSTSSVDEKG